MKTQCVFPLDTQNNVVSSGHLLGKQYEVAIFTLKTDQIQVISQG